MCDEIINFSNFHMQGILVFASVMATLGLQIILESVRTLHSDVSGIHLQFLNVFS